MSHKLEMKPSPHWTSNEIKVGIAFSIIRAGIEYYFIKGQFKFYLSVKVFILAFLCSPPVRDRKSKDHAHSDEKLLELINEEKIFRVSALSNTGLKRSSTWI